MWLDKTHCLISGQVRFINFISGMSQAKVQRKNLTGGGVGGFALHIVSWQWIQIVDTIAQ